MTEWRPIPGFPKYEVSSEGQVRSVPRLIEDSIGRKYSRAGKTLVQMADKDGYQQVTLYSPIGEMKRGLVHRLVLMAFHGQPTAERPYAAHRDGNPANNHLGNLYWATSSENALDRVRHGRDNQRRKTHCPQGHEYTAENTYSRNGRGRQCRECSRKHWREYWHSGTAKAQAYRDRKRANSR